MIDDQPIKSEVIKRPTSQTFAFDQAKKKLRIALSLFVLASAIPLVILARHIDRELEDETLHRYQALSEELALRINERIEKLLRSEQKRPFNHYTFYTVSDGVLPTVRNVAMSPLAQNPPVTGIPGIVGFFQIAGDGTLSSPYLPDLDTEALKALDYVLRPEEIERRASLWAELKPLVSHIFPTSEVTTALRSQSAPLRLGDENIEIDPLQLRVISENRLLFFRKAWVDRERYIQGFIVDKDPFLLNAVVPEIGKSVIGGFVRATLLNDGTPLMQFDPGGSEKPLTAQPVSRKFGPTLYQGRLTSPLDSIELKLSVEGELTPPGASVVNYLFITLTLVFFAGISGVYTLTTSYLELAQQRSNFVSAVSHELKTPLTAVRMYAEMLSSGAVEDEEKRSSYYRFITQECERLSRLINNVLSVAKLHPAESEVVMEEHSIEELFKRVEDCVKAQVASAGFELKYVTGEEGQALSITTDADAFIQIFVNFIDNAVKFSKETTQRSIEYGSRIVGEPSKPNLVCFVRDYGPGIKKGDREKVFQLFYRGGNELTRRAAGTGIGLALVKELSTKIGARLEVVDADPGSEFRLIFNSLV